jgi:rubrerythrin
MTDEPRGALVEVARDDVARTRFLKMAGRTIGSAAAASALATTIAACGSSASSSSGTATGTAGSEATGDLEIVNYALTLEYLEAQFYADALGSGLFASSSLLPTLERFAAEESEHVAKLKNVAAHLGTAAKKPVGTFPMTSAAEVTKLAATLENLGAAAYLGEINNIKSRELLATALAIHSVEARHAATLNMTLKLNPTPNGAFGKPESMQQVLAVLKPFISR